MPKFNRLVFFLTFSVACSSRVVSEKPPIASAASPQAEAAPVKKATLVLDQDPPLPNEPNQQWQGLEGQPDQERELHHPHSHHPNNNSDVVSKPVQKEEQEHRHVH